MMREGFVERGGDVDGVRAVFEKGCWGEVWEGAGGC